MLTGGCFEGSVYVGLNKGYTAYPDLIDIKVLEEYVQKFIKKQEKNVPVTITPTTFINQKRVEPGAIIKASTYPDKAHYMWYVEEVRYFVYSLGYWLMYHLDQNKVSVVFTGEYNPHIHILERSDGEFQYLKKELDKENLYRED